MPHGNRCVVACDPHCKRCSKAGECDEDHCDDRYVYESKEKKCLGKGFVFTYLSLVFNPYTFPYLIFPHKHVLD